MTGQKRGKIWGLGMGPGDPELITVKALNLLRAADVVAYPAPSDGDSLVRSIAAPYLTGGQEEFVMATPMVPAERFSARSVYDWAAEELHTRAKAGKNIVVLCEGDPFFYGSFMYLFARLAGRVPVEVVPGVSSLMAGTAELGLPLAARNDVVAVVPGPMEEGAMEAAIKSAQAAVVVKVGRHLPKVRRVIERLGLGPHARYIERATLAEQRIFALADIPGESAPYFSLVFVHNGGAVKDL
jgi:precorrin-2/cobalt-factor-2 C20-methyltransferase